jgi:2-polyprenyl-6-methoxyphenol hydroxylase-like FAD-dependent oxidoreductase
MAAARVMSVLIVGGGMTGATLALAISFDRRRAAGASG